MINVCIYKALGAESLSKDTRAQTPCAPQMKGSFGLTQSKGRRCCGTPAREGWRAGYGRQQGRERRIRVPGGDDGMGMCIVRAHRRFGKPAASGRGAMSCALAGSRS